jgi:hypothetical protein
MKKVAVVAENFIFHSRLVDFSCWKIYGFYLLIFLMCSEYLFMFDFFIIWYLSYLFLLPVLFLMCSENG